LTLGRQLASEDFWQVLQSAPKGDAAIEEWSLDILGIQAPDYM
jgi:hypothetical protein